MHFLQKYKVVFPHSAHRPCFALPVQELNMSDFTLQKLWFPFLNLKTRLFGWFFCNVNNTCQQCCVGIQGSQVDFALGFLLSVGKFEMHCLHRDLHKEGILATIISCFCPQSYTWLCFDPNDQHRSFLRCIF